MASLEISFPIAINLATLISIIVIAWRFNRFLTRMEYRINLMWADYTKRKRIEE